MTSSPLRCKISWLVIALMVALGPVELLAAKQAKPPRAQGLKILKKAWAKSLKGGGSKKRYFPEMASPVVDGERIFVGTHSGYFYSIRGGKTQWQFLSDGPIASQAATDQTRVFFGNNKGSCYALDKESGQTLWNVYVGGEVLAQPLVWSGRVYVVTTSREVYALDASSGQELWVQYVRGFEKLYTMRGTSSILSSGNALFVAFADGQIARLSPANGQIQWSRTLAPSEESFWDIDAAIVTDGNDLYVAGYFHRIYRLNGSSGNTIWVKDVGSGSRLQVLGDHLYIASQGGHIMALDRNSGIRQWDVALNAGALSSPVIVKDHLFIGTERAGGYLIDRHTGKLLQQIPISQGVMSFPSVAQDTVYLLTASARLEAYQPL